MGALEYLSVLISIVLGLGIVRWRTPSWSCSWCTRIRAQLKMKGHPNRALQRDWDADGPNAFLFEVLDLLPPAETAERDSTADLATLEELWTEKLELRRELRY